MERSKLKILLLDDELYMLKLVGVMLTNLGFTQITECDRARAALALVADTDQMPDLIFLDLNMPEMDGIEFVRHLVELRYTGALILVSGENERVLQTAMSLIRAHQMEILGRLHKPFSSKTLADLLTDWDGVRNQKLKANQRSYSAADVRAAIDNREFVNYYQPQVTLATGQVSGVEVLVRWRHPQDGMVGPDQFIGIAEEHGLIDDLTTLILVQALSQLKIWQDMGLPLRISINVSMENLSSLDFPDFVAHQTAAANLSPEHVILEVTESRLMKDSRAPLEILTRLRLKRFGLSIDDFGTGHSSLSQLRDFPFGELKVDRSFVHGACRDETMRAIYDASLSLSRQLDMECVAEGVEDRDDWDFLRKTGCQLAQGYFIAKPMPASDLPVWMTGWKERVRNESLATTSQGHSDAQPTDTPKNPDIKSLKNDVLCEVNGFYRPASIRF